MNRKEDFQKTRMERMAEDRESHFILLLNEAEAKKDKLKRARRKGRKGRKKGDKKYLYALTDSEKLIIDRVLAGMLFLSEKGEESILNNYYAMAHSGDHNFDLFDRTDFLNRMSQNIDDISFINTIFSKWQEKTQL